MASTRCRIGLVGAGAAATQHAATLAGFHDVVVVGVTDPDIGAAARLAGTVGAAVAPDLAALLAMSPDAVYVCIPPLAHGPVEDAILDAGLPFYVEPPLSLDTALPTRIAARVAATGVATAVGHHWRYSTAVLRAAEALAERPVRLVSGAWLAAIPPAGLSGGLVVDQVVHLLDLARALAGEVREVYAVSHQDPDGATAATLRFTSGAVGALAATSRLDQTRKVGLDIYAEGASVSVTENGCEIRVGDRTERHAVDAALARRAIDRAFVSAVRRRAYRAGVLVDYVDGVRSHLLAMGVARSAAAGYPVRLG